MGLISVMFNVFAEDYHQGNDSEVLSSTYSKSVKTTYRKCVTTSNYDQNKDNVEGCENNGD